MTVRNQNLGIPSGLDMVTFTVRLVNQPVCGGKMRLERGMPGFVMLGQFGLVVKGLRALRIRELEREKPSSLANVFHFR